VQFAQKVKGIVGQENVSNLTSSCCNADLKLPGNEAAGTAVLAAVFGASGAAAWSARAARAWASARSSSSVFSRASQVRPHTIPMRIIGQHCVHKLRI